MKSLGLVICLLILTGKVQARVQRFAVLVGNNSGDEDEANLKYAEADAARMFEVLVDLGDFPPENTILLKGKDAEAVERVLIRINDQIRSSASLHSAQSMVLFYYSGHADAQALHLGGSRLELEKLESLVRGSAAHFRLLIVDACRSGALTRSKGMLRREPPFSTSRTLAGTQHPSFRYDIRGRGDATLTRVVDPSGRRALVSFPLGRRYLVLKEHQDGPVVVEIAARDKYRQVSVKAGTYFVRGRGRDHLLEGRSLTCLKMPAMGSMPPVLQNAPVRPTTMATRCAPTPVPPSTWNASSLDLPYISSLMKP